MQSVPNPPLWKQVKKYMEIFHSPEKLQQKPLRMTLILEHCHLFYSNQNLTSDLSYPKPTTCLQNMEAI